MSEFKELRNVKLVHMVKEAERLAYAKGTQIEGYENVSLWVRATLRERLNKLGVKVKA